MEEKNRRKAGKPIVEVSAASNRAGGVPRPGSGWLWPKNSGRVNTPCRKSRRIFRRSLRIKTAGTRGHPSAPGVSGADTGKHRRYRIDVHRRRQYSARPGMQPAWHYTRGTPRSPKPSARNQREASCSPATRTIRLPVGWLVLLRPPGSRVQWPVRGQCLHRQGRRLNTVHLCATGSVGPSIRQLRVPLISTLGLHHAPARRRPGQSPPGCIGVEGECALACPRRSGVPMPRERPPRRDRVDSWSASGPPSPGSRARPQRPPERLALAQRNNLRASRERQHAKRPSVRLQRPALPSGSVRRNGCSVAASRWTKS